MTIQNHLSGKTALVTGASRGIGRATALALAQAGAQVIIHYGNGEQEAAAVVSEIRNAGGKAEKVAAQSAHCRWPSPACRARARHHRWPSGHSGRQRRDL